MGKTAVLIISYGLVAKHSRVAGFGSIKLTEEHKQHKELQGDGLGYGCRRRMPPTEGAERCQTRAAWAVREHAKYVWGLTGTPIESDVLDLWSLLHFIDPVEWPSKTKFIDMWVMAVPNHFGGIDILGLRPDVFDEFKEVTEWHWRRQLKSDDLPPVVYDTRYCELVGKAAKAYKDMKKQLMAELDSDGSFRRCSPRITWSRQGASSRWRRPRR